MHVVLFFLCVSQIEVILSHNIPASKEQLHEGVRKAVDYFGRTRGNCNALLAYTQILVTIDKGCLEGNG